MEINPEMLCLAELSWTELDNDGKRTPARIDKDAEKRKRQPHRHTPHTHVRTHTHPHTHVDMHMDRYASMNRKTLEAFRPWSGQIKAVWEIGRRRGLWYGAVALGVVGCLLGTRIQDAR